MVDTQTLLGSEPLNAEIVRWEQSLLIVSIPHAAAFGAFIGTYDFKLEWAFIEGPALLLFLQATTVWLKWVHDLLRGTFLQAGHMGFFQAFKHGGFFILCFIFPIIIALVPVFVRPYVDETSIFLIGITMFSWVFSAIGAASHSYLKMMKLLRINLHD